MIITGRVPCQRNGRQHRLEASDLSLIFTGRFHRPTPGRWEFWLGLRSQLGPTSQCPPAMLPTCYSWNPEQVHRHSAGTTMNNSILCMSNLLCVSILYVGRQWVIPRYFSPSHPRKAVHLGKTFRLANPLSSNGGQGTKQAN